MTPGAPLPAARLMDRIYRRQRHVYDATRKYYLLGRDRVIAGLAPPPGGSVLEIGCGTGRNLIHIARSYPQARCFGLDVSSEMLETARAAVARAGLADRIALAQADATGFDPEALFGLPSGDRIVISYALSMIPPWRGVVAEAGRRLAPGGELHIVDFGDQSGLPGWFKAGLRRWLREFHVTPRDDLGAVLDETARTHGLSARLDRLYRGYAVHGVLAKPR